MNLDKVRATFQENEKNFGKFNNNLDKVNFALKHLNLVSSEHDLTKLFSKNDEQSAKMRETGNAFFKTKNYFEALESYSASICWAKTEKLLSFGYANRSAALAKLGLYSECLIDIERAFKSGYPNQSKQKLISRQQKIKELEKISPPKAQTSDSVEWGPCLQVEENEEYGRHMLATRDIQIGEILLIEKPLGAILSQDFSIYCHECLTLCYNPIPCLTCSKFLFCSSECRDAALDNYHRYECPILGDLDADFILALKITLTVIREIHANSDYSRYNNIYKLKSHEKCPKKQRALYSLSFVAAFIFQCLKEKTSFFTDFEDSDDLFKGLLLQTFLIGHINGVLISRLEPKEPKFEAVAYGKGIYLEYSLFNHSCYPNAFFYNEGSTLIVRALSTIKKGEQCYISYGPTYSTAPKSDRQNLFLSHFNFVCTCRACEENWFQEEINEEFAVPFMCVAHAQMQYDHDLLRVLAPTFIARLKQLEDFAPIQGLADLRQMVVECFQIYQTARKPSNRSG